MIRIRKAIMLAAAAAMLVPVGHVLAQEPAPEPEPEPEPVVVPVVVPDMPFGQFRVARVELRDRAVKLNRAKCRRTVHPFLKASWQVRPDRRAENLAYWRGKVRHARAQEPVCSPRQVGRAIAEAWGWGSQFFAIDYIWSRESGWNPCAYYPSQHNCAARPSSACGIPQFLPCSKLLSGRCEGLTLGGCSVKVQIRKGYRYIRGRYGNPTTALYYFKSRGWY